MYVAANEIACNKIDTTTTKPEVIGFFILQINEMEKLSVFRGNGNR